MAMIVSLGIFSYVIASPSSFDSAEKPLGMLHKLSMNGKSPIISTALPFVLRLSKDERWVFQQNHY
jgi:hypothetical protein